MLRTATWLERLRVTDKREERALVRVERELFVGFYAIRKMLDTFKVSPATKASKFTLKVARQLLERLKQLLVLNWRQKAAARSSLRLAIEDILDSGLPRAYSPEMFQEKCSAVVEHVYESYPERNAGVYSQVA